MKTLMFNTAESMTLGNIIGQKLKRPPKSFTEITNSLEKYFGLKAHPEKMADFGFWTLNTVVDEQKFLGSSDVPKTVKDILNDPKRIYENYEKNGTYKGP